MVGSSFLDAVYVEFDRRAVKESEGGDKGLHFSDADDAHSFLQKCLNDAPSSDVVADAISLAEVKRVFSEQSWSAQPWFSKAGVGALLEFLVLMFLKWRRKARQATRQRRWLSPVWRCWRSLHLHFQ